MSRLSSPTAAVPEGAHVTVCEVGPRDGFQNEKTFIPTDRKVEIVNALFASGLRHMQVTSFVSPRAVPQLADAEEVLARIDRPEGAYVSALVPNLRGAERAVACALDAVHTVVSASETHNRKNVNRPIAQSLSEFEAVTDMLKSAGITVEGGIATAFGCPFEGVVPPEQVAWIARRYQELGADSVSLGDTTGMATPLTVRAAIRAIREAAPGLDIHLHFHNTRGVGLACVMTGLAEGVTHYDAAVGGLGGCPFAAGATGNICTEDLVYLLQESGYATGIDLDALISAAQLTQEVIGRSLPGQVIKAGPRLKRHDPELTVTAAG
ncbi:hydroxymethylglutaryl-CoA lyase [Roseibacterium sp. SDUM158017]|uniref:hydroxymethylglutaryl-CoA lyase n=1 Tax=Roseicyclus salinarum TaxID=3036773 RepID=UPI0024151981|nr:hydroxymethylglutaryl-CoA lyase [Roseibacterium sp. SDUM158017]MDG4648700.1 hydroxymethylglutaryl-CoA lyase [Roseibacterium sp. SDUM158017]